MDGQGWQLASCAVRSWLRNGWSITRNGSSIAFAALPETPRAAMTFEVTGSG
jgi:hypothetical protein